MNYKTTIALTMLAIIAFANIGSAYSYNADMVGESDGIGVYVHNTIKPGTDGKNEVQTMIVPTKTTGTNPTQTFKVVSDTPGDDKDYFTGTVTINNNNGDNIVNTGQEFHLDVMIPAGVTVCVESRTDSIAWGVNTVNITLKTTSGTELFSTGTMTNAGYVYVGMKDGIYTSSTEKDVWFTTTEPIIAHLDGGRERFQISPNVVNILVKKG